MSVCRVCVQVYLHMNMYTYIHKYLNVCRGTHTYIHELVKVHNCMYMYAHINTSKLKNIHNCLYTYKIYTLYKTV